jgi:serine/threonine-protein kinase
MEATVDTTPAFGKYTLIAEIGQGGMADVFLAVAAGPAGSGFSKLSVIKRLRRSLAEDPEFIRMLVDEARIAARLNHPNVVQTNEVGNVGSEYFMAMEYLEGQPLHRIQSRSSQAARDGRKGFPDAMQYVVIADALAGLHHAHELKDYDGTPLQIVHRDVTPHNIFVTYEGQVKVVDFGIAKAVGRASETQVGVVKGKIRYMAPEQALGGELDRRADLFSVGIILWEVVAGKRFWGQSVDGQILQELAMGQFPSSVRDLKPDVPEALDQIVQRALAWRPEDRFPTAAAFRNELERFLADSGQLFEARRDLGGTVATLFQDRRAELSRVIDTQLAELTSRPSAAFKAVTVALDPTSAQTPSGVAMNSAAALAAGSEDETAAVITGPSTTMKAAKAPPTPPTPGSRLPLAAFAAAGMLLAVGGWLALRGPAGGATGAPSRVRDEVSLKLTVRTPGGRLTIDGRDMGGALISRVARDANPHRVAALADGYLPTEETLSFAQDLEREYVLVKAPAADKPAGTAASPTAAAAGASAPSAKGTPPWKGAAVAPKPSATATTASATVEVKPPASGEGRRDPVPPARRKREIDTSDPFAPQP